MATPLDLDPLSFWSNLFPFATPDQRRMVEAWALGSRGLSNLLDIARLWKELWGAEKDRWGGLDASRAFPLNIFPFPTAMVPMHEYLSLVRRHERLKEKVADQEKTIRDLKLLLNSDGRGREGLQAGLEKLMKHQVESFFSLLRGVQLPPYK